MTCPQCNETLNLLAINTTDGKEKNIYECLDCGGHFLENYLVNFISTETAHNIDSVLPKKHNQLRSEIKCPHCGQIMFAIQDDEGIPKTVTVYNCPNSHGDFFPKGDLLYFKKAQDAKVNYHKLWGIPLKTAFAVIIPLFILFTSVTVLPSLIREVNNSKETRIKASELTSTPLVTPLSDTEVLISFSTSNQVTTKIIFVSGVNKTYTVSETPDTNHILQVKGLAPSTSYKYIIVIDPLGKNIQTGQYTFSTP
ncbi:hypothetical protein A2572_03160 [Candidatus Collierbacteria bacterium RIFOXYD1_FULL_40_9]|uniref:Transcription factor zinc-finger domain-containing protein n=1 Tax=Candidatus Collierbacteria bacterium RIFOXYD1_FULL_40_9 TaxID=1817731 RepID=A0A1F5FWV3_9BACT|nr:MAG: hypothetical protein A2572_03160 [Candidatus Collierbacteria bacterium RIFOXYD1_FULL_40_9]